MANKLKEEKVRIYEVRNLTFRGAVSASAFLFDFDLMTLNVARCRILSMWHPGMRVYAVKRALVLILPQPMEVYTKHSIGLPLVSSRTGYGAPLVAMPLSEKLLERIKAPSRSIVRCKEGKLLVEPLEQEEDLATWLFPGDFTELELISPAVSPRETEPMLKDEKFDVREKLASGSPKAEGMDEFIESLNKGVDNARQRDASQPTGSSGSYTKSNQKAEVVSAEDIERWFNAVLGKIFKTNDAGNRGKSERDGVSEPSWLDNVLGSLFRDQTSSETQESSTQGAPPSTWAENLKLDFYRMLQDTGLLSFIVERQRDYTNKMIDLFEQGDWSEALKYAVPLSSSDSNKSTPEPYLDIPSPRSDLRIDPNPASSTSSLLYSHPDLHERLRKLYRASIEQLTNEGRHDEAAFVLVELLGEIEEAVAYLERYGRLVLAAELAEARKLRPSVIVRQWFLAGNVEKAVGIARLHGCFAEAIRLLEKDHKDLANSLKETWAMHLAEVGNYSSAALIALDVPELHDRGLEWTRLALQLRDKSSGHLLACWLTFFKSKDDWPEIKDRVVKLLDDESRELAPARFHFIKSLAHPYTEEIELLAKKAGRAVLRDHGRQYINLFQDSFLRLVDDQVLKADVSQCNMNVETTALIDNMLPIELSVSPDDIGTCTIYDAALLPDGRTILALGEEGVCVLDTDSRGTAYFSFPAHQFVLSSYGDRLLAVSKKGKNCRITRLDLLSFQFDYLGEAPLTVFATAYDGSLWYAANDCELFAVDATQPHFRVLWQMPDVLEEISSIVCNEKSCSFATNLPESANPSLAKGERDFDLNEDGQRQLARRGKRIWSCDLPGLVLRGRKFMNGWIYRRNLDREQALTTPSGLEIYVGPTSDYVNDDVVMVRCEKQKIVLPHHWTRIDKVSTAATNDWIALSFTQIFPEELDSLASFSVPVSSWCYLIDVSSLRVRAEIFFDGATRLSPRLQYDKLTLCDDRGRVMAIDLANGAMLRNICI